jgi:hypothetical protein
MNFNPMQIMNMMKNKSPQEIIISIIGNQNPIINNLMKLAKSGNKSEIEDIARNMCKEKGIDFDKEFPSFMENFKNQK